MSQRDACDDKVHEQREALTVLSDNLAASTAREAEARRIAVTATAALNECAASRDAAAARAEAMSAELASQLEKVKNLSVEVRSVFSRGIGIL